MGKSILFVGGAGGIGSEAVEKLKKTGRYDLKVLDSDGERLRELEGVEKIKTDINDYERVCEIAKDTDIDILVNCAGYQAQGSVEDLEMEEFEKHIQTNYLGAVNTTKAFLPQIKQNGGKIVNVSSIAGKTGIPFLSAYCASKYALEGFTDTLRKETLQDDIKVVLVEPGRVKTGFNEKGAQNVEKYLPDTVWEKEYREMLDSESYGGISQEKAGRKLAKIIQKNNFKTRYTINHEADLLRLMKALTPTKIYDKLVGRAI